MPTATKRRRSQAAMMKCPHLLLPKEISRKTARSQRRAKVSHIFFLMQIATLDLNHADPHNVVCRKVKINNNLIMACKMIEGGAGKAFNYNFPALVFQKRATKTGAMYEFNVPLDLTPRIVNGCEILMKENPKLFKTSKMCKCSFRKPL